MCGRFAMDDKVNAAITEFVESTGKMPEDWRPGWEPSWNIAPTENIPLLFESGKGEAKPQIRFEPAYWSLVPSWSKTLKLKASTFNARAEDMAEKPLWRGPVKSHRAIVLANGYYEWQGPKGHKIPYFIRYPDDQVMGFAGLYSWWADPSKDRDDDSRWRLTATIVTSDAVQTLADIHDRNPVILPQRMWEHWIDPTVAGDQALVDEAVRAGVAEAESLRFDQVGPVRGDGPELIEPVA
ncbi:SOS response-associated peptidase [Leifsonia sp. NPDC058292]|uniref:SOS response-associated peptidase n=1 Tax=Leifsonia sp. NPDC058292 TaxID=3346428 RepID=UPI0036DE44EA